MNTDETDSRLKRLFHELRTQQARHAPSFHRLARPLAGDRPSGTEPSARWAWVMSVAAALGVCGLLMVLPTRTAPPEVSLEQLGALSQWRATTDVLLNFSAAAWSTNLTTLSDSWLDSTSPPDLTQPNRKETL